MNDSFNEEELCASKRKQHSYTIEEKIAAIKIAMVVGAAEQIKRPRGTVKGWWDAREAILAFEGCKRRKTLGGQGRHEQIPFSQDLVTFLKDQRRLNKVIFVAVLCRDTL
jgi:hypothetical protein